MDLQTCATQPFGEQHLLLKTRDKIIATSMKRYWTSPRLPRIWKRRGQFSSSASLSYSLKHIMCVGIPKPQGSPSRGAGH